MSPSRRKAKRGEHLALVHVVHSGPMGSLATEQVVQLDDTGRHILRHEVFDASQHLEAIALLDELGNASESVTGDELSHPDNAAVRMFDRSMGLTMDGRLDEVADLYSHEMVMDDHRPVIGGVRYEGRDDAMSAPSSLSEWGYDRMRREVVDQRGDRFALIDAVMGNDEAEVEVVVLSSLGPDGLLERIDLFDPDQMEMARAKLDELAAAG